MKTTKPMLEYLSTCSRISLESFELARLNDRANLRKELIEVLDELIEVDIQSRIAEWILVYRQKQDSLPRRARRPRRRPALDVNDLTLPLLPAHRPANPASQNEDASESDSPAGRLIAPHRVRRMPRASSRTLFSKIS